MPINDSIFFGLIHNGALLIAVTIVYDYFWKRDPNLKSIKNQISVGLLVGAASFIIMRTPWVMQEGTIFDTRSVLLSVSGLFFGAIPTIVGMIITIIIRWFDGGSGVVMGITVAITSTAIGLVWRQFVFRKLKLSYFLEILLFSLIVHAIMLAAVSLLPSGIRYHTLTLIWIPTLVIYPIFTLIFSFFLAKRAQFWKIDRLLRSEQAKLQSYFSLAPDAVFICDNNGGIVQVNSKFEQLFNITQKNQIEDSITKYITIEERKVFLTLLRSNDTPNNLGTAQIQFLHPAFPTFHSLVSVTKLNENEFIGIIKDIDEIINTQKELIISKEKAEESNRIKTKFLSSLNHEIRTPLNAIIGFSDLLKNDPDPSATVEYADIISQNGYNLLHLFESAFELARLQSDESHNLILSTFPISGFMKSILELAHQLKQNYSSKAIEISLSNPSNCQDQSIETDKNKLHLLLKSLIENALRFTNEGKITISFYIKDDTLTISIQDTGIGIPKDKQSIIFDAFRKADETNTGNNPGLGLGLTICIEIVSLLKGHLKLISSPNQGSNFVITLPIAFPLTDHTIE